MPYSAADLLELDKKVQAAKEAKSKAEGNLEQLEAQKKVLEIKLQRFGVTEANISQKIAELEAALEQGVAKLKKDLAAAEAAEKGIGGLA